MELKVLWLQLAEVKLVEIFDYYKVKAGKRIARDIINGIVDTTEVLSNQPEIGQIEENLKHRKIEYR